MKIRRIQNWVSLCIGIVVAGALPAQEYSQLSVVDSLMAIAIDSSYFPGAQLLIAKDGQIIYQKAFGHHTYKNNIEVELHHLYDLASLTKVASGLPILMQLASIGKFDINKPLKEYFPKFKKSNKAHIPIRDILSHQGQFQPYFVFWKEAQNEEGTFKKNTFKKVRSKKYPIKISDSLFLNKGYKSVIIDRIKKSDLLPTKEYKYSGLLFLILPDIIKNITDKNLTEYLYQNIYNPLNISRLRYKPTTLFSMAEIIPTEYDSLFRKQQVHGSVHDETAAMLDGISCNAGLFGNAESVYKLFDMYLQKGKVKGHRYIREKILEEFTTYQFPNNRRGLGFDKPPLQWDETSYVAKSASPSSFGHSGFTGTFAWADPTHDLIVILLTNRVYPTRKNRKIYTSRFRPRLHQAIYNIVTD